jgi:hypothetical protein
MNRPAKPIAPRRLPGGMARGAGIGRPALPPLSGGED